MRTENAQGLALQRRGSLSSHRADEVGAIRLKAIRSMGRVLFHLPLGTLMKTTRIFLPAIPQLLFYPGESVLAGTESKVIFPHIESDSRKSAVGDGKGFVAGTGKL